MTDDNGRDDELLREALWRNQASLGQQQAGQTQQNRYDSRLGLARQMGMNMNDPMAHKLVEAVDNKEKDDRERRESRMSPPGALNLPDLLEARRLEYAIPDGAFAVQASFDRILIWQITDVKKDWSEAGLIIPDTAQDRLKKEAPRGILVSAGLSALDSLVSNGYQLGHIVRFLHLAPYVVRCETIRGADYYTRVMDAGDLFGSEDLSEQIRNGDLTPGRLSPNGLAASEQHVLWKKDGTALSWRPREVKSKEDY